MPRAARTGSSLLLLGLLLGAAPQDMSPTTVSRHLRFLAGNDPSARKVAVEYLDSILLFRLSTIQSMATRESAEVQAAFKAFLPHPMWRGLLGRGTVGQARKRDLEVFGTSPERTLDALARGALKLLEGNREDRTLGLRLLERAPASDPAVLDPFLKDKDPVHLRMAVLAIGRTNPERALKEALRILGEGPDDAARQMGSVIRELGTEALTPELLRILGKHPNRVSTIANVLSVLGNKSAEDALIPFIKTAGETDLYRICDTLSQLGGKKSIGAIRALMESLPEGDKKHSGYVRMLVRLRDPKIAAEVVAQGKWFRELHYLGDRKILDLLVRGVKERKFKLRPRASALELIGLLGTPEDVPLLLEHLNDDRFREQAARGLAALGDPKTARPVADALRSATLGDRHVKALLGLPLENVEEPILEILDDPSGHTRAVGSAIWVARRSMAPVLRKKLLALITNTESRFGWIVAAARAVAPHLDQADRKLLRSKLSSDHRYVRAGSAMTLGMAGDAKGLVKYIQAVREERLVYSGRTENLLFAMDPEPAKLEAAVEQEFGKNPEWFGGAEFLAHRGNPKGKDLLVRMMASRSSVSRDRALEALVVLVHPPALEAHLRRYETYKYEPDREKLLARVADKETLERLREMTWFQLSQINQAPARVLAYAKDESMVWIFRRTLRRDNIDNNPGGQSNTSSAARALAALGRKDVTGDFLRMLRSRAARKRALGIECLVTLGDRRFVRPLVPLLSDVEEVEIPSGAHRFRSPVFVIPEEPRIVRVRDLATRAIEKLSGQTFKGTPRERAEAAKAWVVKNEGNSR